MPFGLTNAPATFQRLIDTLFDRKKWPFVFTYLDDTLYFDSFKDSRGTFSTCVSSIKFCFGKTEIEYLGHTLTPNGVKPNDGKVKAVQEFPQPRKSKDS